MNGRFFGACFFIFGTKRSCCSIDDYSSILQQPLFLCKGEEKHLKKFDSEVRVFQISCTYIDKMFFIVRSERFT